jgi:hypothetical protein
MVPVVNDLAAVASALFAAVGLIFTGRQLLIVNQQAREERQLGVKGVVVSWRAAEAPALADHDGTAVWRYEIVVANPGRFPIDHVEIRWTFPRHVQRLRYTGDADPPTDHLLLNTPVLPGGAQHAWSRTLRMNFADTASLTSTYAEVTFYDISGQRRTNRWPRPVT